MDNFPLTSPVAGTTLDEMPMDLVIFAVSLFAFIVSMMGALGNYYEKRWKWFLFMLFCVIVSTACMGVELYQWEAPPAPHEMPLVIRSPLSPL
jgi:hypothetical protein